MPRSKPRGSRDIGTSEPRMPGAFLEDGSYFDGGSMAHRGHLDGLVRALIRRRRETRLTPQDAAMAIEAANAVYAFPSHFQWKTGIMANGDPVGWPTAWAQTAAEEAVKREGRGVDGHWCGDRWMSGTERDCEDTRHRSRVRLDEQRELVGAVMRHVENPLVQVIDEDVPPPPE